VIAVVEAPDAKDGQMAVVLDKTICHPQGGGQPNDEGYLQQGKTKFTLENLMVKEDVVLHIGKFEGAPFKEGSAVECHISEEIRRIHARVHSAGHLLDIAMNKAGRSDLKPGKGFHQPVGAYVEYIGNVEAKDREPLLKLMNEHCKEIITKTPKDKMVYKKICEYDEA